MTGIEAGNGQFAEREIFDQTGLCRGSRQSRQIGASGSVCSSDSTADGFAGTHFAKYGCFIINPLRLKRAIDMKISPLQPRAIASGFNIVPGAVK